ncbi:TadE family type IV pilus minor pilin [Nocardioides gansuensis]|uniref:TadE family type IV pilus minor pilin n=1 Tax=Nocardioides gansuensis TaxID=2138300 RepID=UPI001BA5D8D5|nr:TadE family type IV pilus minor pilin [Nocardioides gansuensis]
MTRRDERGAVTAELALGLPLLLSVIVGLVWLLSVGAAQVRVVDASREAARASARGDDTGAAADLARQVAPAGAEVSVGVEGGRVVVETRSRVRAPAGLFSVLPDVWVSSTATALEEGQ